MTQTPVALEPSRQPVARPQSLAEARAKIDQMVATQPLTKASGYVKVENTHYHVAQTPSGPIVSLLEWKKETGERPGFAPVHNLFAVDLDARDKAVLAWNTRKPGQAPTEGMELLQRSSLSPVHAPQPSPAASKNTRTGVRG